VTFEGAPISSDKWTDTQIVARIPGNAKSADIAVYRDGETSNAKFVKIRPKNKCLLP
jgi:hypothetical protein